MPPPLIGLALLISVATPAGLILWPVGSFWPPAPGRRFVLVIRGALLAFFVSIVGCWASSAASLLDILAGAALLVASILATFVFWSLICWGFTLNMLLALDRRGERAMPLSGWAAEHSGGAGYADLCADRMQVLQKAGFARPVQNGAFAVTGGGHIAARFVMPLRRLFDVPVG